MKNVKREEFETAVKLLLGAKAYEIVDVIMKCNTIGKVREVANAFMLDELMLDVNSSSMSIVKTVAQNLKNYGKTGIV
jgi:hypothetical protein